MIRWRYQIPTAAWVLLSVIAVELAWVNDKFTFLGFIVYSLIIAATLEVIRNRILRVTPVFNRLRFVLFVALNGLLGIPFSLIVVLLILPTGGMPWGFGDEALRYADWQQYIVLGYGFIWFAVNALLLRLNGWVSIALLVGSLFVVATASMLVGLAVS